MIHVTYSDYEKKVIEEIRIEIGDEQYKLISPIEEIIIVDGQEVIDKKVQIKTVEEKMSYAICEVLSKQELKEKIMLLQSLAKQINEL